jgi:hypothetical protein
MAVTQNTYTGNGSTTIYSLSFSYLDKADVKVTVNNVLVTNYIFATASSIQFSTAPSAGAAIRIYRDTDTDQTKATFFAGSAIKAKDLNSNFTQTLYAVQEIAFSALNKIGDTMQGILNMGGFRITNLGTPAADADGATKKYVDDRYGDLEIPGVTRWRKTATAGQTTFSGGGDYGGTLAYSASRETVFVNGALQQRNVDYTADNGTSIVFIPALVLGDVVDVHCVNNAAGITTDQASGVYWAQSGTGAITRTVDSKLKDVVSVKDFGATGNGTTDDTAAIQAAINAALSRPLTSGGAGSVFFPAGSYKVTSTINIPPRNGQTYNVGLRIYGEGTAGNGGSNTTLVAATGFTGTGVFKYNQGVIPPSVNEVNLEFDHFGINGGFNVANGIEVFCPICVSIHDVTVIHCSGSCIKLTGGECYSVTVQDVYIGGGNPLITANPAVYGIESNARYAMYSRIVMDGGQTGINFTGDNSIIQNCHLEGQATCINFTTNGAGLARITSCLLNSYGAGLGGGWPASGTGIKITGTGAGAALRNFIGFNQIDVTVGASSTGIYLASAYQSQIFSNRISGAVNGIYVTSSAAGDRVHYIEGNNFIDCTTAVNNQISGGRIEFGGGNYVSSGTMFGGFKNQVAGWQWGRQILWARNAGTFTGTSVVDGLVLYNGQTPEVDDGVRIKFDFSSSDPLSQATHSASITARSKLNYGNATELVFSTADNYIAEAERLILQKDGVLRPAVDNSYSFGTGSFRWTTIYAATGTINTSDGTQKQQIKELSTAERTVATVIKGLIRKFKFNDAVEAKGDDARIHVGVIAQDVEQAFIDAGLDPAEYGLFCRDEWWELDGQVVPQDTDGAELKVRLGVRYEELLAFIISAL